MNINFIKYQYDGWELVYFDKATNFRSYQFYLIKNYIQGNIAEIGPGNGENLKYYKHLGKNIFLYEPSIKSFIKLKKNFLKDNIFIKKNYFKKSRKKFDSILYLHVLEHIKNDQIELLKAYKALKKGGHLIINVPAFSHLFSNFDRDVNHLRRYNKRCILNLTKGLKIKIVKMIYYDSLGYLFSLLSKIFVKEYKKKFKEKIKFWNFFMPLSRFIDIITFNLIGKSLLIIIKK